MKYLAALLGLFVILAAPINKPKDLVGDTLRSIVFIEHGEGTDHMICTGFMVRVNAALTARHCVVDGDTNFVDGEEGWVRKVSDSLALVEIENYGKPALEIAPKDPPAGTPTLAFGYGYGRMQVFHRGISANVDGDLTLDGPLVPGMSGGPVVDLGGKVVGINQASNPQMGVVCGPEEMAKFLK